MHTAPQDLFEKLEFNKVKELLRTHCLGELGALRVDDLTLSTSAPFVRIQLREVSELLFSIEQRHHFPMRAYEDISEALKMLRIEGYVLAEDALQAIVIQLRIVQSIFRFFGRRDDIQTNYPTLYAFVKDLHFEDALIEQIDRVVNEEGKIRPDASSDLLRLRRLQSSKRQELDKVFRAIAQKYLTQGLLKENVESFRNGRRVLAVPSEFKRQVRGIIHDESASGRTAYIEPEGVIDINNDIFDLQTEEKREIYRILRTVSAELRPFVDVMQRYQDALVHYDVVQAKAQLAQQMKATMPKVLDTPHFKLQRARHPLLYLKNKHDGKPTVPFTFQFTHDNRILVLSGPNAGGKSIVLKAVGLFQLMTQAGLLIPVEKDSEIGIVQQTFADIGDQQSLEDELSTYSSRLQNARYFLEHATPNTLVLIDEFGSGTDPKMGGAIAESILRELNRRKVFGVITTHYSNLKFFAFKQKGIVNGSMIFDKDKLTPTYKLKVGKPGSSYAFEIAQKSGLPKPVIAFAKKRLGKDVKNFDELLVDLEREQQEVKEIREKLEKQQKHLDHLIKNYEYMQNELQHSRKRLKLQRKEQELMETSHAQKELQKTIRALREEENARQAEEKAKELLKAQQTRKKNLEGRVDEIKEGIYEDYKRVDGEIEEGSHVALREGGARGVVQSIQRKRAEVLIGNIRMEVKLRDLVLVHNPIEKPQSVVVSTDTIKKQASFKSEVDIRGMRHSESMSAIEQFMDAALVANVATVRIIHGKGTGTLRTAVRRKLREYRAVTQIYHPEGNQGGDGVTIAEIE